MTTWTRGRIAAVALAAAVVIGLLAWQAITRGGAAVIALQMTAMLTAALGPVSIYTYVQRRRDAEDRRADED